MHNGRLGSIGSILVLIRSGRNPVKPRFVQLRSEKNRSIQFEI
jgi:hypothetical protein